MAYYPSSASSTSRSHHSQSASISAPSTEATSPCSSSLEQFPDDAAPAVQRRTLLHLASSATVRQKAAEADDVAVAADGSFVEVADALIARRVKKLYDAHLGAGTKGVDGAPVGSQLVIQIREIKNGRKVYRIRPRSGSNLSQPFSLPPPELTAAPRCSTSSGRLRPARSHPTLSTTQQQPLSPTPTSAGANTNTFPRRGGPASRAFSADELFAPVNDLAALVLPDPSRASPTVQSFGENVTLLGPPQPHSPALSSSSRSSAASAPRPVPLSPRPSALSSTLSPGPHLREAHSWDSQLTAKGIETVPLAVPDEDLNALFDVFQRAPAIAGGSGGGNASSSAAGSLASGASGAAHRRGSSAGNSLDSVVQTPSSHGFPGDDPRFVVWGEYHPPGDLPISLDASASPRISSLRSQRSVADLALPTSPSSPSVPPTTSLPQRVILAATPYRWIAQLTSEFSYDESNLFFKTYRQFISPSELARVLFARWEWTFREETAADETARATVRVRTFVMLRSWIFVRFGEDFLPNRALRKMLGDWLNRTRRDERVIAAKADKMIKKLKDAVRERQAALDEYCKKTGTVPAPNDTALPAPNAPTISVPDGGAADEQSEDDLRDLDFEAIAITDLPPPALALVSGGEPTNLNPALLRTYAENAPGTPPSLSRAFASTLGKVSRMKRRILSTRPPAAAEEPSTTRAEAEAEKGAVEGETSVVYVRGGLDGFLRLQGIIRDRPTDDSAGTPGRPRTPPHGEADNTPRPPASPVTNALDATSPTLDRAATRRSLAASSRRSYLSGGMCQLDDIDSDDDLSIAAPRMRRFPPRGDGGTHDHRPFSYADSMRSGSPSVESVRPQSDEEDYSGSEDDERYEGELPLIDNFVLDGLESDDDDKGDVEAALRALEGHIDEAKQAERARRVEMMLEKSRQMGSGRASNSSATYNSNSIKSIQEEGAESEAAPRLSYETRASSAAASSSAAALARSPSENERPSSSLSKKSSLILPSLHRRGASQDSQRRPPSTDSVRFASSAANSPVLANATPVATLSRKSSMGRLKSVLIRAPAPAKRSWLLRYKTNVLARQFALIERDLFLLLKEADLSAEEAWRSADTVGYLAWEDYTKDLARRRAATHNSDPGGTLRSIVARFNMTVRWTVSEALLSEGIEERAAVIAKLVRLAFKCHQLRNFMTMTAIVMGLDIPAVKNQPLVWNAVPKQQLRMLGGLKRLVSPEDNFRLLRSTCAAILTHNSAILASQTRPAASTGEASADGAADKEEKRKANRERSASNALGTVHGAIPFFGLFVRDIASAIDLPDQVQSSEHLAPAMASTLPELPSSVRATEPLVNVHKLRLRDNALRNVHEFQQTAYFVMGEPEGEVFRRCLKLRVEPIAFQ